MAIASEHGLPSEPEEGPDPEEAVGLLLRDLRASPEGLSTAEAQRRLLQYGPNELRRRHRLRWRAELAEQLTHPLALLLWAAAALSFAVGNGVIAIAVLLVIFLNAAFALAQELQAERAVEALSRYLPQKATALRDGQPSMLGAELVPGDMVVLEEGERVAEPGSMDRPPRPANEGVIRGPMLVRAWLFLGLIVAALSMGGFFFVLINAGWHLGAPVGTGHPLHHAYLQATTMSFVGMIAGQIGTAFAVRTRRESLRSIGVFSNLYLLAAIAGVILFAAVFVYLPPLQSWLGTAALPARDVLFLLPYPFVVWGADELRRWALRRRARISSTPLGSVRELAS